ncbi:hypothetical protein [Limisalsivibrio acetivorans]|uniref:hypothetical protein n=1 Tax=Limisalsivibrio acetivorans TaxID=1304888 RepID=UPI0003B65083|nr:hypothetical protein [Limisalsivibrio acetivorans]
MALLSAEELREEIQQEDFDAITGGDDTIAENAVENARDRITAVVERFGLEYDEEDKVIRLALKKMALCELYTYSADWVEAENFRKEASDILAPLAPVRVAESAVKGGSSDWNCFS